MDNTRGNGNAIDVERLVGRYYDEVPNPGVAGQRVAFGTSGHRGPAERHSFNEAHIHATRQAICLYRAQQGIDGPLFMLAPSTCRLQGDDSVTRFVIL